MFVNLSFFYSFGTVLSNEKCKSNSALICAQRKTDTGPTLRPIYSSNHISIYLNDTIHTRHIHNDAEARVYFIFHSMLLWFCFPLSFHSYSGYYVFHSLHQFYHLNWLQLRCRLFLNRLSLQSETVTNYRVSIGLHFNDCNQFITKC